MKTQNAPVEPVENAPVAPTQTNQPAQSPIINDTVGDGFGIDSDPGMREFFDKFAENQETETTPAPAVKLPATAEEKPATAEEKAAKAVIDEVEPKEQSKIDEAMGIDESEDPILVGLFDEEDAEVVKPTTDAPTDTEGEVEDTELDDLVGKGRTGKNFEGLKTAVIALKAERKKLRDQLKELKDSPQEDVVSDQTKQEMEALKEKYENAQLHLFMTDIRNSDQFIDNITRPKSNIVNLSIPELAKDNSVEQRDLFDVIVGRRKLEDVDGLSELGEDARFELRDLKKQWRSLKETEESLRLDSKATMETHQAEAETHYQQRKAATEKLYRDTMGNIRKSLEASPELEFLFKPKDGTKESHKAFNERLAQVHAKASSVIPDNLKVSDMSEMVYKAAATEYMYGFVSSLRKEVMRQRGVIKKMNGATPKKAGETTQRVTKPAPTADMSVDEFVARLGN